MPDSANPQPSGGAVFSSVQAISLTGRVTAALKQALFSGHLKPGDQIIERQVAREMNVGTPVVREALLALQHEGFLNRVNPKAAFVTSFSAGELRHLDSLRLELETLALQWARPRVTEPDLAALQTGADRLADAARRGDHRDFLERDFEFHRRCWRLSGNPFLAEMLERSMAPLFAFTALAGSQPPTAFLGREHSVIVEALRSVAEPEFTVLVRNALANSALRSIPAAVR